MWSVLADTQQYHSGGGALGGAIIAMIMVWAFWPKGKDK